MAPPEQDRRKKLELMKSEFVGDLLDLRIEDGEWIRVNGNDSGLIFPNGKCATDVKVELARRREIERIGELLDRGIKFEAKWTSPDKTDFEVITFWTEKSASDIKIQQARQRYAELNRALLQQRIKTGEWNRWNGTHFVVIPREVDSAGNVEIEQALRETVHYEMAKPVEVPFDNAAAVSYSKQELAKDHRWILKKHCTTSIAPPWPTPGKGPVRENTMRCSLKERRRTPDAVQHTSIAQYTEPSFLPKSMWHSEPRYATARRDTASTLLPTPSFDSLDPGRTILSTSVKPSFHSAGFLALSSVVYDCRQPNPIPFRDIDGCSVVEACTAIPTATALASLNLTAKSVTKTVTTIITETVSATPLASTVGDVPASHVHGLINIGWFHALLPWLLLVTYRLFIRDHKKLDRLFAVKQHWQDKAKETEEYIEAKLKKIDEGIERIKMLQKGARSNVKPEESKLFCPQEKVGTINGRWEELDWDLHRRIQEREQAVIALLLEKIARKELNAKLLNALGESLGLKQQQQQLLPSQSAETEWIHEFPATVCVNGQGKGEWIVGFEGNGDGELNHLVDEFMEHGAVPANVEKVEKSDGNADAGDPVEAETDEDGSEVEIIGTDNGSRKSIVPETKVSTQALNSRKPLTKESYDEACRRALKYEIKRRNRAERELRQLARSRESLKEELEQKENDLIKSRLRREEEAMQCETMRGQLMEHRASHDEAAEELAKAWLTIEWKENAAKKADMERLGVMADLDAGEKLLNKKEVENLNLRKQIKVLTKEKEALLIDYKCLSEYSQQKADQYDKLEKKYDESTQKNEELEEKNAKINEEIEERTRFAKLMEKQCLEAVHDFRSMSAAKDQYHLMAKQLDLEIHGLKGQAEASVLQMEEAEMALATQLEKNQKLESDLAHESETREMLEHVLQSEVQEREILEFVLEAEMDDHKETTEQNKDLQTHIDVLKGVVEVEARERKDVETALIEELNLRRAAEESSAYWQKRYEETEELRAATRRQLTSTECQWNGDRFAWREERGVHQDDLFSLCVFADDYRRRREELKKEIRRLELEADGIVEVPLPNDKKDEVISPFIDDDDLDAKYEKYANAVLDGGYNGYHPPEEDQASEEDAPFEENPASEENACIEEERSSEEDAPSEDDWCHVHAETVAGTETVVNSEKDALIEGDWWHVPAETVKEAEPVVENRW